MKNFSRNFLTSWKTTSAGLLMVIGGVCLLVFAEKITQEIVMGAATSILGGIGLAFAKDGNVTGGTKDNGQTPP